jgi:PAS domain-containing protein
LPAQSDILIDRPPVWTTFLESSRLVVWLKTSREGIILAHNRALELALGQTGSQLNGTPLWPLVTQSDAVTLKGTAEGAPCPHREERLINLLNKEGQTCTLSVCIDVTADGVEMIGEPVLEFEAALRDELLELNNRLSVLARENERKSKALLASRAELERTAKELRESYWHIRKIQEFLPICMQCGKVKSSDSKWDDVVHFLMTHSLFLSHGYCPGCAEQILQALRKGRQDDDRNDY